MGTVADVINTVLNVAATNYPNYGATPDIYIRDRGDISVMQPGEIGVVLKDKNFDYEYTFNGVRIAPRGTCEMKIAEENSTKRDNLFEDIMTLFENSSYDLTIHNPKPIDERNLYTFVMTVRLAGRLS